MANPFSNVWHFFGKVGMGLVSLVHKVDQGVDAEVPVIDKLLEEGASVAAIIPGIGPKVASILNAGVQLVGDFKATVDGLDAVTSKAVEQLKALAPSGYSIVLIKQDVEDDIKTMLQTFETEYNVAKDTVSKLSDPPSTTTPVVLKTTTEVNTTATGAVGTAAFIPVDATAPDGMKVNPDAAVVNPHLDPKRS